MHSIVRRERSARYHLLTVQMALELKYDKIEGYTNRRPVSIARAWFLRCGYSNQGMENITRSQSSKLAW